VSVAVGVIDAGNYTPSTCVMRSANGVEVTLGTFVSSDSCIFHHRVHQALKCHHEIDHAASLATR